MGIQWIQIDEPVLSLDLEPQWLDAFDRAYPAMARSAPKLLLATYFDTAADHADRLVRLPVHGIHLDLVRAPLQLERWQPMWPEHWVMSAGVVDGRNIWRADLRAVLARLRPLHQWLGGRPLLAPSCSLLPVPASLDLQGQMHPAIRPR